MEILEKNQNKAKKIANIHFICPPLMRSIDLDLACKPHALKIIKITHLYRLPVIYEICLFSSQISSEISSLELLD